MAIVIGVRFKKPGKVYYFDPCGLDVKADDPVVVETVRGVEMGECARAPYEVPDEEIVPPLRKVVRIATEPRKRAQGVRYLPGKNRAA